jgi:glutamate-ammonia-ligase adenylyltransferase
VGERAEHLLRSAVYSPLQSTAGLAAEVRRMRKKLEESAEARDLKRGRGGLADVEFLVQYLQLRHGPAYPPVRQTHTLAALQALLKFRMLTEDDGRALVEAYEFFSRMANRIRVVHGLSANQLPDHPADLRKLALRAGYGDAEGRSAESVLSADFQRHSGRVSALFDRLVV